MTERDLKDFLCKKRALDRAENTLRDFETAIYGPTGSRPSGTPQEKKFPEDKMAIIAHRHNELRRNRDGAEEALRRAEANLLIAATALTGDELIFFRKRYVEGKSFEAIMLEMHISRPTSFRLRCRIIEHIGSL